MRAESKSPEQIEDEIRGTRRDIDRTLSALQGKLSPGQLLDHALGYLKESGGEFSANLGRSVRRNPIATTLTGIGLTWLMIGKRSDSGNGAVSWDERTADDWAERPADVSARAEDAAEHVGAAVGGAAEKVRAWGAGAREGMRAAGDTAAEISHRAGDYAHSAWDRGTRVKDRTAQALHDYPLTVGLLGLAVGALAAALLPSTRREDELMGAAADDVKRAAREAAGEATQKVADAAEGVAEEAAAEAQQREDVHLQMTGPGPGGMTFGTDPRAASEESGGAHTEERR